MRQHDLPEASKHATRAAVGADPGANQVRNSNAGFVWAVDDSTRLRRWASDSGDGAAYTAFENVEPTGKRFLLALDVSGSMTHGSVAGVPGLTPRYASAALALVTAATETGTRRVGFYAGPSGWATRLRGLYRRESGITPLAISPRQRSTMRSGR